ncbi:hypothetical protein EV401DRAFT_2104607 [Pisolithus croceorrhizus]|nr:hypothetical protein EV401DRAFT_2104607 [Pisolithus croceorrhizus]
MGVYSSAGAGWGYGTIVKSTAMKLEIRDISTETTHMAPHIPHLETRPKEPDKAEDTGGGGDDAASKDILDSRGVEKTSLANSGSQQGERKTRWQNGLPAPPEMPPNGFIHPPRTLTDRYCHGRIKTDLQKLSTGQEMERQQGGSPVPPAPPPNGTYYIHKASKGLQHHARLRSNAGNKLWQAKRSMAVRNQPTWDNLPSKGDNGGRRHGDATRSGYADSHRVKESLLTDEGSQHSEQEAKRLRCLPAAPAPSPNGILDMPTLFMDLRRRERVKSKAENVSNAHSRQSAYLTQTALKRPLLLLPTHSNRSLDATRGSWTTNVRCNGVRHAWKVKTRGRTYWIARILMRLLQPFSMPSKRLRHPMGGLWIMKIGCSEVRSTRETKTRGHMHRIAGILMRLQQILSNPSRRFRNITNTYLEEGVPPELMRNNTKRPRNLRTAKQLPCSSSIRRDSELRAKWLNDSPAPSKPARSDFAHTPWTLRDLR